MRAGRDRARHRLGVDVAEVLHRQPARVQLARERVQADAGLDPHAPRGRVGVEHAGQRVERDQRPLGHRAGVERVPGAAHPDRGRSVDDRLREFGARARRGDPRRRAALRAGPIGPLHARGTLPSGSWTSSLERVVELQRQGEIQLSTSARTTSGTRAGSPARATSRWAKSPRRRRRSIATSPVVFYCRRRRALGDGRERVPAGRLRRVHHDGRTGRMGGARVAARAARMALWRITDPRLARAARAGAGGAARSSSWATSRRRRTRPRAPGDASRVFVTERAGACGSSATAPRWRRRSST